MADTTEMIENKIKKAQSWEEMEEMGERRGRRRRDSRGRYM